MILWLRAEAASDFFSCIWGHHSSCSHPSSPSHSAVLRGPGSLWIHSSHWQQLREILSYRLMMMVDPSRQSREILYFRVPFLTHVWKVPLPGMVPDSQGLQMRVWAESGAATQDCSSPCAHLSCKALSMLPLMDLKTTYRKCNSPFSSWRQWGKLPKSMSNWE